MAHRSLSLVVSTPGRETLHVCAVGAMSPMRERGESFPLLALHAQRALCSSSTPSERGSALNRSTGPANMCSYAAPKGHNQHALSLKV
eukprot:scaffold176853_cov43-Tisochrysis_lutea.AAC.1